MENAVLHRLPIDLTGFAGGWEGYGVVHYDHSTDTKLNIDIGRHYKSRTTSQTWLLGPDRGESRRYPHGMPRVDAVTGRY